MSILKSCRSCGSTELSLVIDLGSQPLANNLLPSLDMVRHEPRFPLNVKVCRACWLMQLGFSVPPVRMFSEYLYFSSFSEGMLRHAAEAAARYVREKELGPNSFVVEVASNDGYLLRNFVAQKVPCLGVEPAENIAEVARQAGVETVCRFFGRETAVEIRGQRGHADLILGNNVFAHAPDTNDFVAGIAELLAQDGWAVLEFPYGVDMLHKVEFDTIYHEHFFYLTLTPLVPLFARHGLEIFGVERLAIHGGSLRLFVGHAGRQVARPAVAELLTQEARLGVGEPAFYAEFALAAEGVRTALIAFLREQKAAGKTVAAYGASAKGSTLLNYLGEPARDISFIADRSTYKQGKLSPGMQVPVVPAEELTRRRPDYALLLVWNFAAEIVSQQQTYLDQGGVFVIPLPKLEFIGKP
jgi:SAM-dependent methyltransferase